ncbi:uncharacterized protein TNCV_3350311 [Trichonephila clavipes]|nr:uncharacterized protein TNCV_3350311 [Trichonephila clavipes]
MNEFSSQSSSASECVQTNSARAQDFDRNGNKTSLASLVYTQNACDWRAQLKITSKGRTEVQLKTFAAEEGRSFTSVAEEFGQQKCRFARFWKAFQTIDTAVRKFGGGCSRKGTEVDDRYIVLQVKRARYRSASAIAQQQGDKCRRLLWPDAFTKMAYSPAILNAASLGNYTRPIVLYGSECWTINKEDEEKLVTFERKILGAVRENGIWRIQYNIEIQRTQHSQNDQGFPNKVAGGHVFRFCDENLVQKITFQTPEEDREQGEWINPLKEHVWDAMGRRLTARLHPPGNT